VTDGPEDPTDVAPETVSETGEVGALVHLPRTAAPMERAGSQPSVEPSSASLRTQDVDHWGRSEQMRRLARDLYRPVMEKWFRAEIDGVENVPREGGALLVANHSGMVPPDAPIIMQAVEEELDRPVYGLAEHLFRTAPILSIFWSRAGGVPAHPDNAHRLLNEEQQLTLVFPEGGKGPTKHVSQRYQLRRFGRGGFVETAMRAGVPIVPIAVMGAEEAAPNLLTFPRLARAMGIPGIPFTPTFPLFGPLGLAMPLPAKIRVHFLEPVTFPEKPNMPRYSKRRVLEQSERIRDTIQQELYAMLRERKSIWFG